MLHKLISAALVICAVGIDGGAGYQYLSDVSMIKQIKETTAWCAWNGRRLHAKPHMNGDECYFETELGQLGPGAIDFFWSTTPMELGARRGIRLYEHEDLIDAGGGSMGGAGASR